MVAFVFPVVGLVLIGGIYLVLWVMRFMKTLFEPKPTHKKVP